RVVPYSRSLFSRSGGPPGRSKVGGGDVCVCDGGGDVGVWDGGCVVSGGDVEVGGAVGDGASVVGVCDGVSDSVYDCAGLRVGATPAPCSVSRSNLETSSITPKVYADQISAGKPPPLTR